MNGKFREICTIEPRLKKLYDEARAVTGNHKYFCANEIWYARFKPRLIHLVGWYAKKEILATAEAYEVAYQTIYNALPSCRKCGCF